MNLFAMLGSNLLDSWIESIKKANSKLEPGPIELLLIEAKEKHAKARALHSFAYNEKGFPVNHLHESATNWANIALLSKLCNDDVSILQLAHSCLEMTKPDSIYDPYLSAIDQKLTLDESQSWWQRAIEAARERKW